MDTRKKCKVCNFNLRQISCGTCLKGFCQECNRKWHFKVPNENWGSGIGAVIAGTAETSETAAGSESPKSQRHNHDLGLICEECERAKRTVYCIECDQGFCDECHSSIHRKGNRVLHKKTIINKTEDYKILLNVVWIEGSATNSADLINLERVLHITGVVTQKKYTSVHVSGNPSKGLLELLKKLELGFELVERDPGTGDQFIDFIVHHFDAAVFMNEFIVMSTEALADKTRDHLQRLHPSARIKELRMSPGPLPEIEVEIQPNSSQSTRKDGPPASRDWEAQQSIGLGGSDHSTRQGDRGDSKDIDNDAVIIHPETPTPNSSNTGTLQNSSSKGEINFYRKITSVQNAPIPFVNFMDSSFDILSRDLLVESLPATTQISDRQTGAGNWKYKRTRKNFEIKVLATHKFLSSELGSQQMAEIIKAGESLVEYAEVLYGLKELRHANNTVKTVIGTLGKGWQKSLPMDHKFNDRQLEGSLQTNLSLVVQQLLVAYASEGDILVDYNHILRDVIDVTRLSETDAQNLLLRMSDLNIIIINTRQVTQSQSLNLVSLKLEFISLENLFWVVKSLVLDRVTCGEEILIARIKEAFGLKLKPKSWSKIFEKFADQLASEPKFRLNSLDCLAQIEIIPVSITNSQSQRAYKFGVTGLSIEPEDVLEILDEHPEWEYFKEYLEQLFEGDLLLYNQSSSHTDTKPNFNLLDKPIYPHQGSSSDRIDRSLSGRCAAEEARPSALQQEHTGGSLAESVVSEPRGPEPEHVLPNFKAISGGRYGMAQFMKFFGPPRIAALSIGFLSKLVQKAIDTGLLRYYKTFLLKNTKVEFGTAEHPEQLPSDPQFQDSNAGNLNESKIGGPKSNNSLLNQSQGFGKQPIQPKEISSEYLSKIREFLVEVLLEKDNNFPLAQLVDALSQRLGSKFDPKELGYAKLVNFIEHHCRQY